VALFVERKVDAIEIMGTHFINMVYNKARQASITQELLEIVGGAEALKG
jgi:F-type H+-transporting ATPase subunit gamma